MGKEIDVVRGDMPRHLSVRGLDDHHGPVGFVMVGVPDVRGVQGSEQSDKVRPLAVDVDVLCHASMLP